MEFTSMHPEVNHLRLVRRFIFHLILNSDHPVQSLQKQPVDYGTCTRWELPTATLSQYVLLDVLLAPANHPTGEHPYRL